MMGIAVSLTLYIHWQLLLVVRFSYYEIQSKAMVIADKGMVTIIFLMYRDDRIRLSITLIPLHPTFYPDLQFIIIDQSF